MIVEAKTKYGNLWVSDQDHIGQCLLKDYFEEDLIKKSLPYIKPGSIILDIGANVGSFSLVYSNYDCYVYAFEPQSFCIDLLNKSFAGKDNIKIYHNAVGDKNQFIQMNRINPSTDRNIGGLSVGKGGEEVKMIRIDDLELFGISIIKIDVEGYENQVIEGAKKTIKRERPFIIFESHHINPSGIIQFLRELDYECEEIEVMFLKNYICAPK